MIKPKVLIVEDDDSVRTDIRKTLARAGFEVYVAVDCVSGWKEVEKSVFDLILIDLTMPGFDGQMSKDAGIDFLKQLKTSDIKTNRETPVLILTATATLENAKRALNLGALNFFGKSEFYKSKDKIINELKEEVIKEVDRNIELLINKPEELKLQDEDIEVLQKLYLDSKQIDISPLLAGYSKAKVYLVDSINLKGERLIPFVTKIGKKSQIDNEYDNFKNYVEHKISSGRYPVVLKVSSSDSHNIAGMKISFIGADWDCMSDLRSYFKRHSTQEIIEVVENLFEGTFKFWHENKERKQPISILKEYSYFSDYDRLRAAMNRFFKEYKGQSIIKYEDVDCVFYDPVTSLRTFNESFKNLRVNTYVSTIHGDLHVKNVFVDGNKNCWLIDFQYTGKEHILKDFIELETSIKYGCINAGFEELWQMEEALMSQSNFRSPPDFHHSNPELQKVFDVVKEIREYARISVAPSRKMKEYYIGLLYYTLNLIKFPEEIISKEKKRCILLVVSLLFDKFKEPGMNIGFVGKNVEPLVRMREKDNEGKYKVLIVDDDEGHLTNLYKVLDRTGIYIITKARNSIETKQILEKNEEEMFNLCILDLEMPDFSGEMSDKAGLDVLKYIKEKYTYVPVIILSVIADYRVAIEAISRYGAATYFNKLNVATDKNKFLNDIEKFIKESQEQLQEEKDREKAYEIILKTLPKKIQELEIGKISVFFKYSERVGGDFYDVITLSSNELAISIGDISGKGLSTAVQMSKFLAFYRNTLKSPGFSLAHLMMEWNSFLFDQKTRFDFITMFFAVLNQADKTLKFCNAGHNPPFIVTKDGDMIEIPKGGIALGAIKKQEYIENEISLNSGNIVVLYTDGFIEGQNAIGDYFGIKRLVDTVKANRYCSALEIKESVINSFEIFVDPDFQTDDRTLIILKIK